MKPIPTVILHLIGNNGVGKTSISRAVANLHDYACAVNVGQIFRRRYPPKHFQGQMAPSHTKKEALQIYRDEVSNMLDCGMQLIVVDGQPRSTDQVRVVDQMFSFCTRKYLLLHLDHDIRKVRLEDRDGGNEGNLELSMHRLERDYRSTYEVIVELARIKVELDIFDVQNLSVDDVAKHIFSIYFPNPLGL